MPGAVTGGSTSRRRDRRSSPTPARRRRRREPAFHVLRRVELGLPMPERLMTSNLGARAHAREAATTNRHGVRSRGGEPEA